MLGLAATLLAITSCTGAAPYPDPSGGKAGDRAGSKAGATAHRGATAPANGWGNAIAWRSLDEGLAEAKADGRPLMLVVHASWCHRCKELKPKFSDEHLTALAERFVMVNADQDQTPSVLAYAPDGTYIPRILFIDPATGTLDEDLQNPERSRYHYYYGPRDDLTGMMEKALARHGKS